MILSSLWLVHAVDAYIQHLTYQKHWGQAWCIVKWIYLQSWPVRILINTGNRCCSSGQNIFKAYFMNIILYHSLAIKWWKLVTSESHEWKGCVFKLTSSMKPLSSASKLLKRTAHKQSKCWQTQNRATQQAGLHTCKESLITHYNPVCTYWSRSRFKCHRGRHRRVTDLDTYTECGNRL